MTKMMKSEALEDEVWALKSDVLHNYGAYFSEDNPANLTTQFPELSEMLKGETIQKTHTTVMLQMTRSFVSNKKRSRKLTLRS